SSIAATLLAAAALAACRRSPEPPPNVLLVLGDTVRQDAVGAYGAGAGRTPAIDALAASGVRFEQARAQSSWTLPSVASLFTSRWCHEVTDWADLPQKLPEEATTIAELFRARGYATAGFSANVLVNTDNGFAQGFETYWAPSADASMWTDALTTADRAAEWLRREQRRPFFAYVHFVDPHSPYCPPDRRPKDPDTPVPGDMSLSFYGKRPLPDAAELSRWRQLYAEEVALVDRGLARVLSALEPEVRKRTYVVFLSEHGEEFMEHGFLGHGWSLYDELLKVPLIVAGPGVSAGRVVLEPVGLIDLLPTLAGRARLDTGTAAAGFRGIDLSRSLSGGRVPGDRTFLAETYHYGPLRVAVQRGMSKAIFFNKGQGGSPPVTERLFGEERVRALQPREALYDLARDPREKEDLSGTTAAAPALGEARDIVLRSFAAALPGRWVAVRGKGSAGRIEGTVRYSGLLTRLVPFFPRDSETFSFARDEVRVSLLDDGSARAWLAPDRTDLGVVSSQLSAGGSSLLPIPQTDTLAVGWATWAASEKRPEGKPPDIDEQVRRLRALGYLQ
ncbi:MAG: sulfatase family protein, partial [Thermoanaerobaculia bacterium]